MQTLLRRFRAALFVSGLWALMSGGVGLLLGVVHAVRHRPDGVLPDVGGGGLAWQHGVLGSAGAWAGGGAALGLLFAASLAVVARGRDPRRLSSARAALAGGGAAVALYTAGLTAIGPGRPGLAWASGWVVFSQGFSPAALLLVTVLGAWLARLTVCWARGGAPRVEQSETGEAAGALGPDRAPRDARPTPAAAPVT